MDIDDQTTQADHGDASDDRPADPLSLERRLGQRLHIVSNVIQARYYRRTEKQFGVALPEWRVLRSTILAPGTSQNEIADTEGLNVMIVSRAVAGLRRKGLVETHPDPGDRRRNNLLPTELGRSIGTDLGAREQAMYDHVFSALDRHELATLDDLLDRVNELLRTNEPPDPPPAARPWRQIIAGDEAVAEDPTEAAAEAVIAGGAAAGTAEAGGHGAS